MKKHGLLVPFIIAASFSLTNPVSADPVRVQTDIFCPSVDVLSNFGSYIAGQGMELMLTEHNPIWFKSDYPAGVPASLKNYSNSGTDYNPIYANVSCAYSSSVAEEQPFEMRYFITNGHGGRIRYQSNNAIYVLFPIGLR